jgi:hypothetical protein
MNRTHALGFISLIILGAGTAFVACSSDSGGTTPAVTKDSGVDTGKADTNVTDTATGGDSTPGDTGGETSTCDAPSACCGSPLAGKLESFNNPQFSTKTLVSSTVVATSKKFLVSFSKTSGSCLYGFFAADPNATFAPYSGALIIAYGTQGTAGGSSSSCSEGDAIPASVAPGQKFELVGNYQAYGASGCTPAAFPPKVPEIQICSLTPAGTTTVPAPAVVPEADLVNNSTNLNKWNAGWVKVQNVTAGGSQADGGIPYGDGAVAASDKYGAWTTSGGIVVGDKLFYKTDGTPLVAPGQHFDSITGIPYLDYCTWSLWPTALSDMSPAPALYTSDAGGGG